MVANHMACMSCGRVILANIRIRNPTSAASPLFHHHTSTLSCYTGPSRDRVPRLSPGKEDTSRKGDTHKAPWGKEALRCGWSVIIHS